MRTTSLTGTEGRPFSSPRPGDANDDTLNLPVIDPHRIDLMFPELIGVNPGYATNAWGFWNNCQSVAVTVDRRLANDGWRWTDDGWQPGNSEVVAVRRPDWVQTGFDFPWPDAVLNAVGNGNYFRPVHSTKEIEDELRSAGLEARGLVHGVRHDAAGNRVSGHLFNAVNRDGKVFYIDGQSETWANPETFDQLEFLRTF